MEEVTERRHCEDLREHFERDLANRAGRRVQGTERADLLGDDHLLLERIDDGLGCFESFCKQ